MSFSVELVYANQTDRDAWFRVPYVSMRGRAIGRTISLLGVILFWLGVGLRLRSRSPLPMHWSPPCCSSCPTAAGNYRQLRAWRTSSSSVSSVDPRV